MMKKIRPRFANLRLQTKFLLILLLAMAMVCVSTLVTVQLPYSAYDEQLYHSSTQMITLFAERIQAELDDIETLSYRILADNVLQSNLSVMEALPSSTTAWTDAKTIVGDRMSYYSVWFNSAFSLQLKTTGGVMFTLTYGTFSTSEEQIDQQIARAAQTGGKPVWEVKAGEPAQLFLLRQIRETKWLTLKPLATVILQVDLNSMVERYRKGMSRIGEALDCAIYAEDVCVYASGEGIASLAPEGELFLPMRLNGQDVLCVRYTGSNGWRYVTLVDYGQIRLTISRAVQTTFIVIIAAAALALLLSSGLIASVLKHLKILLNKFDTFAQTGKPVPESDSPYRDRRDEIGKLHRHFDRMTREYDQVTRDNAEQQRVLQEKQMQQLRAQVRPHFLYNTLESIYCLAKNAQDERIATMTDALGKMIRASLNDRRDVVSVGEDLQVAREYLRIQLIRYGDRLQVESLIPQELMDCRIPAMTLQPLVENAVHHAAEEMLDTCVIRLTGQQVAGGIDLAVEDNGPGMDEDILHKLETGEIKPEGLGIGMRNIHRRLQYAFSADYGLEVRSTPHCTRIIIHLPDTRAARPEGSEQE